MWVNESQSLVQLIRQSRGWVQRDAAFPAHQPEGGKEAVSAADGVPEAKSIMSRLNHTETTHSTNWMFSRRASAHSQSEHHRSTEIKDTWAVDAAGGAAAGRRGQLAGIPQHVPLLSCSIESIKTSCTAAQGKPNSACQLGGSPRPPVTLGGFSRHLDCIRLELRN